MTRFRIPLSWFAILTSLVFLPARGLGQVPAPLPASTALRLFQTARNSAPLPKLAELRGNGGLPQPTQWSILAYDRESPLYVRAYVVRVGKVTDAGNSQALYPAKLPEGFLDPTRLRIDSIAAFEILNLHAAAAGVRFDSTDYLLRCRPYDTEPIWRLTALDRARRPVGTVDLSGETGVVLRTVWFRWSQKERGFPEVADSAASGELPAAIAPPPPPQPSAQVEALTAPAAPPIPTPPPSAPALMPTPPAMPKAEVGPPDPFAETDPVKVIPLPPTTPSSGAAPQR